MKISALILGLILTVTLSGEGTGPENKDRMIGDLEFIRNTFENCYAPTDWKKTYCNWDLNFEFEKARESILVDDSLTLKKYQQILRRFLRSTKDYHVRINFFSTAASELPFNVKSAGEKYFITAIDEKKLSSFPIRVGDELIEFDGKPIDQVIAEIQEDDPRDNSEKTDRSKAEMFLTKRLGVEAHDTPKGPITIKVKSRSTGKEQSCQINWETKPELITPPNLTKSITKNPFSKHPLIDRTMIFPLYEEMVKFNGTDSELGRKTSFLPMLGSPLWSNDPGNYFQAYLFQTPDKRNIGYLRIPSYMAGEDEANELAGIIDFFQANTEALVIDQLSNPGGKVFYLYAVASMLTDRPLKTPKHRMKITQKDVFAAFQAIPDLERVTDDQSAKALLGNTIFGSPVSYQTAQFVLNYFRFIVSEWNDGRTLTTPYHIFGVDEIQPHPTSRYTKPILLLINELDFSCGDFFPAIMQDNQRAVTMGAKTAGAGGYVLRVDFPNKFGIDYFRYTGSIAERPGTGLPIENLGVTPDIPYELTVSDLQNNYQDFVSQIIKHIGSIE